MLVDGDGRSRYTLASQSVGAIGTSSYGHGIFNAMTLSRKLLARCAKIRIAGAVVSHFYFTYSTAGDDGSERRADDEGAKSAKYRSLL